jgi:hypothetical protein
MHEPMSSADGDIQPGIDAKEISLLRSMREARDAPAVHKASLCRITSPQAGCRSICLRRCRRQESLFSLDKEFAD